MDPADLTVVPIDMGTSCQLATIPGRGPALFVRPYPAQSFHGALDRAVEVTGLPEQALIPLLAPHWGDDVDAIDLLEEPHDPGDTKLRAAIHRRDRWWRAVYAAVVVLLGAGLSVTITMLAGNWNQPDADPPPLLRADTLAVFDQFGVDCASNNGWAAACRGDAMGAFTARGVYSDEYVGVVSYSGTDVLTVLLVDDHQAAVDAWERIAPTITGPVVLLHGDPHLLLWGTPEDVRGVAAKAFDRGWTLARPQSPGDGPRPQAPAGA